MRERLTAKQVAYAKPGRYGDGGGLWLEVSASGVRHWTLRYQINRRARWMGLGGAKVVTLADARERARLARLALLDGIDPLEARLSQRAEQRRAQAATITFREAAKAVIEARESDWSAEHARQWRASIAEVELDPRQPPRGRDRHRACVEGGRADLAAGANDGRPDPPADRGGA